MAENINEPQSPEDPLRAKAIEAAQLAQTLAGQVQHAEGSEWLNNIEPEAKAYYEAHQNAEKALLLSIAISVRGLSGGVATGWARDDDEGKGSVARAVAKRVRGKVAERAARGESEDDPDSVRAKVRARIGKRYGSAAEGRKQPRKHK